MTIKPRLSDDPKDLKAWKITLRTPKGAFVRDIYINAFDETHAMMRARSRSAQPIAAFAGYYVTIEEHRND